MLGDQQQVPDAVPTALPEPHTAALLQGLRDYRVAEEAMRRRTSDSMRMGATDLRCLRYLLKAQSEGKTVSARELADHLEMTSASVTAMLDRLTSSGHVQRQAHATDRRSIAVTATVGSDDEVRQTLSQMHSRMMRVAAELSADDAALVQDFLGQLAESMDNHDR